MLAVIVKGALAGAAGTAAMSALMQRNAAGHEVHWAYGVAWGSYFAVIQSTFRPSPLLHGTLVAGLMTLVATRVMPRLGLVPAPANRQELIASGAAHLVYGWTTAIVYRVLNLGAIVLR